MANNKIIYDGEVLIDLTGDTVTAETMLVGSIAHDRGGNTIEGSCTFDSDTSDADAIASQVLKGKVFYALGNRVEGTMENRGAVAGTISTKAGSYTVPVGYHDGSGKVTITKTEQDKLIPSNIKQGITILGVAGQLQPATECVAQSKTVTPTKDGFTVSPDAGYTHLSEVVVNAIPYSTQANAAGGTTVSIG